MTGLPISPLKDLTLVIPPQELLNLRNYINKNIENGRGNESLRIQSRQQSWQGGNRSH